MQNTARKIHLTGILLSNCTLQNKIASRPPALQNTTASKILEYSDWQNTPAAIENCLFKSLGFKTETFYLPDFKTCSAGEVWS